MKHITQQQADYIRAHVNDRPRVKVARDAGVSLDTVYRIVREAGGEMRYEHTRRNPEHVEIVRRCYPVMTTREIADRYGIGYGRVNIRPCADIRRRIRVTGNIHDNPSLLEGGLKCFTL